MIKYGASGELKSYKEFTDQFESLKEENDERGTVCKSLRERNIKDKNLCAAERLVETDHARCIHTIPDEL